MISAEYHAVSAADWQQAMLGRVCCDLSMRTRIELAGSDRTRFLHNLCTQHIQRLPSGSSTEAIAANIKGRILGYLLVGHVGDSYWLEGSANLGPVLVPHFSKYRLQSDVQIADRSEETFEISVLGPAAIPDLGIGDQSCSVDWFNRQIVAIPTNRLGISEVVLIGPAQYRDDLLAHLNKLGCPQVRANVWDGWRIRAAYPETLVDVSEENFAQESGRTRQAIAFDKGCYLGQEPIARIDSVGHVNQSLCRLKMESGLLPQTSAEVFDAGTNQLIGHVTSWIQIPCDPLDRSVVGYALACLRSAASKPGTPLVIVQGDSRVAAVVDPMT